MRVLHFYKTYSPETVGGIEKVINQIAIGATRYGVETEVLYLSSDHAYRAIEIDGHTAHAVPRSFQIASTAFSLSAFKRFSQLAKNADVIHYHFPWPFMDVVHLVNRVKKPCLVTYHSDIVRQKHLLKLYRPIKNQFLHSVDHIVATSPNYLETSVVLKRFKGKVSVIPIGLDKDSYPIPDEDRLSYWRKKIGERFFLFVGVLRYYKGLHILIEAARNTEWPIVIVGAGPIEEELKAQASASGVNNVIFLGKLSEEDKVALLILCYCVVFPSHLRSEAFGISLLEGAMYGKPMISSEIGTGTTFINIGNETGLVIPPSDPDALRVAMRTLWDQPGLAKKMGLQAEMRYWQHFTSDQMVRSYVTLYEQLSSIALP